MLKLTTNSTEGFANFKLEQPLLPPVFYSIGEYIDLNYKHTHSWHLKTTIGTSGFIAESPFLNEEFEIQNLIEEYLTKKVNEHTSIRKICSVFNEQGEIEYHWYIKDPLLNFNFEEIEKIRDIKFSLERDDEWQNVSALLKYISPFHQQVNSQNQKIQGLFLNALN